LLRPAKKPKREEDVDVHEYQAKELLAQFGVPVPKGAVAFSPDQAVYAATELGGWNWAVKAQIHAGARGKAGGIKLCKTYHEVREAAADMLGKRLVTIQTRTGRQAGAAGLYRGRRAVRAGDLSRLRARP
jgi:succinyl-CoA synthetase beta subunit